MDDKSFFHEGTLRICGSLDIDEVFQNCLLFSKQFMPLECIDCSLFDPEIGGIKLIARAAAFKIKVPLNKPIPLSKQAQYLFKSQAGKTNIIEDAGKFTATREISSAYGLKNFSLISMPLRTRKNRLCVVACMNRKPDQFNQEHARLLELLSDPFSIAISNHLRHQEVLALQQMLKDDNRYLQKELHRISGDEIVGEKFGLRHVMDLVQRVAPLDNHVLLLGETGVGKDVIANAIHYSSPRRLGPMIKVNCGAIPDSLLDSELFGHEKGSFTGAISKRRGRFERANHGTIYLDEVGELPMIAQVRLLRVLQEKKIERIGGTDSVSLDVRVLAATHRDLEEMVAGGEFRKDLWFRLNVFPITIPPLRDRKEDIPAFVQYFIDRKIRELNLKQRPELGAETLKRLQNYAWPGNVRELENMVERELIRCQTRDDNKPILLEGLEPLQPKFAQSPQFPANGSESTGLNLDEVNRRHILRVLDITNGKVQGKNGAAALLGLNASTLRSRMRKLGIPFGRSSA